MLRGANLGLDRRQDEGGLEIYFCIFWKAFQVKLARTD